SRRHIDQKSLTIVRGELAGDLADRVAHTVAGDGVFGTGDNGPERGVELDLGGHTNTWGAASSGRVTLRRCAGLRQARQLSFLTSGSEFNCIDPAHGCALNETARLRETGV